MAKARHDWRKLPRKPADRVRSTQIIVRVTENEKATLFAKAQSANMNLSEYIMLRCLGGRD